MNFQEHNAPGVYQDVPGVHDFHTTGIFLSLHLSAVLRVIVKFAGPILLWFVVVTCNDGSILRPHFKFKILNVYMEYISHAGKYIVVSYNIAIGT